MNKQDGAAKAGKTHEPLVGYRMFGIPCETCGIPLHVLWVFKDRLEMWHDGTESRCVVMFTAPTVEPPPIPEEKPDSRRLPRRYANCRQCGVRFMKSRNGIAIQEDLCKACRNQQELFTHDEITQLANGLPPDSE